LKDKRWRRYNQVAIALTNGLLAKGWERRPIWEWLAVKDLPPQVRVENFAVDKRMAPSYDYGHCRTSGERSAGDKERISSKTGSESGIDPGRRRAVCRREKRRVVEFRDAAVWLKWPQVNGRRWGGFPWRLPWKACENSRKDHFELEKCESEIL